VKPEVLVRFTEPTRSESGELYWPRAVGGKAEDGLWDGWIEFVLDGDEDVIRTERETTQPNRFDLVYWAEGLSAVYLEGALQRALAPATPRKTTPPPNMPMPGPPPASPRGRHSVAPVAGVAVQPRVVLDPFVTYAEGEELLRSQLRALSHDHLQNIVEAYQMADADWAREAADEELVERIIEKVRP
jgi:hypothetical protein